MYVRNTIKPDRNKDAEIIGIEMLPVTVCDKDVDAINILCIYRPDHVPSTTFSTKMKIKFTEKKLLNKFWIVIGDFNTDFLSGRNSMIIETFEEANFEQVLTNSTHISGSTINYI